MSSTDESYSDGDRSRGWGVVARPPFQLRSLPIRYRWEVTRRHPYYQLWWKPAAAYYRKEPIQHPAEAPLRLAVVCFLAAIGVAGEPPDPATEFEQLESGDLNLAWLSGAVHPITFRGLVALLIAALPKETVGWVGTKLVDACRDDKDGGLPRKHEAIFDLSCSDKPGLDQYPDEPIVCVNPAASGRQITEAISQLTKQWKQERDLGQQRDRSDKYVEYLKAWDLREGWTGSSYDSARERKLKDIASESRQPIPTITHHYCSAFEMVVGHAYSRELWARLFGPIKLTILAIDDTGAPRRWRPLKSPARRPVPESVVYPVSDDERQRRPGAVESAPAPSDARGLAELVQDIETLLSEGRTDEEIVDQLEMTSSRAIEAVAYLRERSEDPHWRGLTDAIRNNADDI